MRQAGPTARLPLHVSESRALRTGKKQMIITLYRKLMGTKPALDQVINARSANAWRLVLQV